jgi:hypothetical protein
MNDFVFALCRNVTCAAAAILITLTAGASFVESTSVAPATSLSAPPAVTASLQA